MAMTQPISPNSAQPSAIPAWKKRVPMAMTLSRIAVCPIFIVLLILKDPLWHWLAAGLFMAASATDFFDGYFARKYDAITNMGKFMDPIADKILVASVLIMLLPTGKIDPILVLLLLARDILIGGIRSIAAADNIIIDAKPTGKWKTGLQMVSIPAILIAHDDFAPDIGRLGYIVLWVSVILSVISAYQYITLFFEERQKIRS
jgi:CDP-diacylglycerol--glycerol-3-phosphate 3-phosphatidyltransferase